MLNAKEGPLCIPLLLPSHKSTLSPRHPPCLLGISWCILLVGGQQDQTSWSLFEENQSLFGCVFLTAALTWTFFTLKHRISLGWIHQAQATLLPACWHPVTFCLLHTSEDSLWQQSDYVSILQTSPLWDKPLGGRNTHLYNNDVASE